MIPVTKPFLPPRAEYERYLDGIWERNWLTNQGPLANELELKLKEVLGLEHLLFLANGTLALQLAIKALELSGEIITTPFSYVATTSSILWEGCFPVFVDINPETLNIDHQLVESAITKHTSAILATHVYGNPCDIEALEKVSKKYNIKLIFDAAHCFGTRYKGRSVFEFGDISTASFHATKLFHTIEGGAVITKDAALLKKMAYLRNFGHEGPYDFEQVGINAKNSEFHAAMGLCNLKHLTQILNQRKALSLHYNLRLEGLNARRPVIQAYSDWNFSYYPIILKSEAELLKISAELEKNYIYSRRYFYPSLNTVKYINNQVSLTHSESIASRVLCLPLYHTLSFEEVDMIARIVLRAAKYC